MVSIKWCLNTKNGLEIISPNINTAESYLKMAEESIYSLQTVQSRRWTATMSYYIFYYSLYSLMSRIGIKCEIHLCSLAFMKNFLTAFYSEDEIKLIEKAFSARIDLQYYANRPVDTEIIDEIKSSCKDFYIKTKTILSSITEEQIQKIRGDLEKCK